MIREFWESRRNEDWRIVLEAMSLMLFGACVLVWAAIVEVLMQ